MAGEIGRDLRVRLIIDSSEAESKLPKTIGQFTELNSALELTKKAFGLAMEGWQSLTSVVERGQQFTELSNAFKNLYGATSTFANDGLGTLREALQGTVADIDIMRAANQAAQAGLDPEAFLKVAEAAEALGDVVGKDAKEAMADLSTGLALGNERLLKQYGILVDNGKAEAAFAKSIGTTADQLSEAGKKEAFRIAALEQMTEKSKAAAGATATAGDALERFESAVENAKDGLANFINNNSQVKAFFTGLADLTNNATLAFEKFFETSARAKVANAMEAIEQIGGELAKNDGSGFLSGALRKQQLEDYRAAIDKLSLGLTELGKQRTLQSQLSEKESKTTVDSTGFIKDQTEARQKLTDEIKKQTDGLTKLDAEMKENSLGKAIQESIDSLDTGTFNSLLGNYRQAIYDNTLEGLKQSFKDIDPNELAERATALTDEKIADVSKALEDKTTEAFQNSVGVFQDLFQNAIDGTTFNLEDALKRVAVGFASQMAASIAGSLGINVGSFGSAGGIGQAIAASLGFGGGGQAGIGSILGGVFGGSGGVSGIGPVADGGAYGGMLSGAGGIGSIGFGPLAGIGLAAAGTGYAAYDFYNSIRGGSKPSIWSQAALAPLTGGLSFAGSLFGGSDDPERIAREDMISKLIEQMGGQNKFGLDSSAYNVDFSKPNAGKTVGLVGGLADILGGGGKMSDDLAGIFTNAVNSGEDFNKTLIATQALMKGLNVTAEEGKDLVTQMFLDGKISLEEYNADMQSFTFLQQKGLEGVGDITGAVNVFSDSLSDPRTRLHAIAIGFEELKEIGIDTPQEIASYMHEHFSPEVAAVFDGILSQGISSFEGIGSASSEQINFIINLMIQLGFTIDDSLGNKAEDGTKRLKLAFGEAGGHVDTLNTKVLKLNESLKKVGDEASKIGKKTGSLNTNAP